jgi:hypothetical protein
MISTLHDSTNAPMDIRSIAAHIPIAHAGTVIAIQSLTITAATDTITLAMVNW